MLKFKMRLVTGFMHNTTHYAGSIHTIWTMEYGIDKKRNHDSIEYLVNNERVKLMYVMFLCA